MLIERNSVQSLDPDAKQRLIAAAPALLKSLQNSQVAVMFEGRYYPVAEIRSLLPVDSQVLLG